jgi:hypothetical protein
MNFVGIFGIALIIAATVAATASLDFRGMSIFALGLTGAVLYILSYRNQVRETYPDGKLRIIEDTSSSHGVVIHTSIPISTRELDSFYPDGEEDQEKLIRTLGRVGRNIIRRILELEGVREICLRPYRLAVYTLPSAEIEQIGLRTRRIIEEALRTKAEVEYIRSKDDDDDDSSNDGADDTGQTLEEDDEYPEYLYPR